MKHKILIIEDDLTIQKSLEYILNKEHYSVRACSNGEDALDIINENLPDIVLLDLLLPGISGIDVCKILNNNPVTKKIFIIMLTGQKEIGQINDGLNTYADDYITKPFEPSILIARINALLRRKNKFVPTEESIVQYNDLKINYESREVKYKDKLICLTKSEYDLLNLFVHNKNIVLTRSKILENIRDNEYDVEERMVDYLVAKLRKKISTESNILDTIRGVGYIFKT